jgi:hypothetical protein
MVNGYNLIACGCSFTKNGYLTEQSFNRPDDGIRNYHWSEWYSHLTNKSSINLGNQTNDNISICRTVLYYLDKFDSDEVIIQWSSETRYPFFVGDFPAGSPHVLNYTQKNNSSFFLTGGFRYENDIPVTIQNPEVFELQKHFARLTEIELPMNQVLHWFELWALLIKRMDELGIKRKYFSMTFIDFEKYLKHPLLEPYVDLIRNEFQYYKNIDSGALEYALYYNDKKDLLKPYLIEDMDLIIFREEIDTPDWIQIQLNDGNSINNIWGHPSSVVYNKFVKEFLLDG